MSYFCCYTRETLSSFFPQDLRLHPHLPRDVHLGRTSSHGQLRRRYLPRARAGGLDCSEDARMGSPQGVRFHAKVGGDDSRRSPTPDGLPQVA